MAHLSGDGERLDEDQATEAKALLTIFDRRGRRGVATMRVFISWSGELSRPLAEVLRDWLPSALQFVKPYFSPNDIEKGSRWEGILAGELSASSVGIFVMTHENRDSRWLHFEAGVIAKSIDRSRVCPMLFGIEPTDLEGPLAHFQSTRFTKDD